MALITVVVPAFNEEKNIPIIMERILSITTESPHKFEIIFVNDGSSDNSAKLLLNLSNLFSNVYFINFSRNFGQQNAIRAGYERSNGEAVICMDADLQNPPEIILDLVKKWEEGYDVVACRRKEGKQNAGLFKELSSRLFYRFFSFMSENKVEANCPDFRLVDRKLIEIIRSLPENDIFLRGIISWMGFKRTIIEYQHGHRSHGHTQYSLKKMFQLATTGLTSFSVRPLHFAIYVGLLFSILSLFYIPYVFIQYYSGHTISGWSSLIVTVTFLGGLQLVILGVIGLYLGKLFMQSKQRPDYIVKDSNIQHVNLSTYNSENLNKRSIESMN